MAIRSRCRPVSTWLSLAMLAGAALAQGDIGLDVRAGSVPGVADVDLGLGQILGYGVVLVGVDSGPTPLAVIDPTDTRSLRLGPTLPELYIGTFGLDQHMRLGPFPIAAQPSLIDAVAFVQGISLFGPISFVDQISWPMAVRFGPAGLFRDRSVVTINDRSFGIVLPRRDGRWMIVGGGRGALLAQVADRTTEIYDDMTDTFVSGPNMTVARSLHTATLLPDGRWLLVGGVNVTNDPQALCEVYDPATDAFTAVAPMLSPRAGHTATLLADGRVFVTGGLQAMTVTPTPANAIFDTTNTTEIYNPATDTWVAGPNLRTPRAGHLAMLRPDGRVLLAGGISWDDLILFQLPAVRSSTDLYNPVTNAIAAGPGMATPHSLVDPVPLGNNRWLVAGGISALTLTNLGTPTTVAEVYDAVANTWSPAGNMATARGNHRAFALGGGRFLAVGGANGTITSPTPLASGEIYDVATNAWTTGPALTIPRAGAAGFLTPRGQYHVIGGGTANGTIARSCEWYFF